MLYELHPLSWNWCGFTRFRGEEVYSPDFVELAWIHQISYKGCAFASTPLERGVLSLLLHGRGGTGDACVPRIHLKVVRSQCHPTERLDLLRIQFGRNTHALKEFLCDGEPQFLQNDVSVSV